MSMHPPERRNGPPPQGAAIVQTAQLYPYRNRHRAAVRLPELGCGCRDPWLCRCAAPEPSEKAVEGYASAVELLNSLGYPAAPLLPEMRALWRRGRDERRIMQQVARRWEMVS
jgi:hypothetical protein